MRRVRRNQASVGIAAEVSLENEIQRDKYDHAQCNQKQAGGHSSLPVIVVTARVKRQPVVSARSLRTMSAVNRPADISATSTINVIEVPIDPPTM